MGEDWAGEALKRSTPMNRTPMKPGTKPLRAKTPMARGTSNLRARKPKADKPKRAAREAEDRDLMDLCRGRVCYLLIPGVRQHGGGTMPCHSNQSVHGKGSGLKAHNRYTVPGCAECHRELDQGMRFSKAEKFAIWDAAYDKWVVDRENLYNKSILI